MAVGVLAALAVAGLLSWYRASPGSRGSTSPTAPHEVSLAVLPFADLSAARDQDYLSEGMADEIINQLAQLPSLRLVGLRSSLTFKGHNEDLRSIGQKLGVDNLLDGTIRKEGTRLRIAAQLVRARDGTPLWSRAYDRELRDVFTLQEDIARDVAQALSVKLDVGPMSRAQGGTTNLDAYDRYLRWRQIFLAERHAVEDHRQRVHLLREAVQADSQFALAWCELAIELDGLASDLEDLPAEQGGSQAGALREEAAQARARVLQLAPESWMALRIRSELLANEKRWAESIEVARRILDSGPFTLERAYPYTNVIFAVGHINETIEIVDRVLRVEPLVMFPSRDQQWNLTAARRFEEAAAEYQRSKDFEGAHAMPDYIEFLRVVARESSSPAEIRAAYDRSMQSFKGRRNFLASLEPAVGDRAAMRALVRRLVAERAPRSQDLYGVADALGEPETALASLRAYFEGNEQVADFTRFWELWINPYSSIRTQPGFKDLLRKAGVVDYWRATGRWGDFCKPVGEDFECR